MEILKPGMSGRMNRQRLRCRLMLLLVLIAGHAGQRLEAQAAADEYQVKAAFILNFARFVDWPADALPPSAPMMIAIVGDGPLVPAMNSVLRGKLANGHLVQVHHPLWSDDLSSYRIIFISTSEETHLPEILRKLAQQSVLTVSDIERFSLRGGVIELVMVGNRVRFDINREPAAAARLRISSRLFNVARAIHERGGRR